MPSPSKSNPYWLFAGLNATVMLVFSAIASARPADRHSAIRFAAIDLLYALNADVATGIAIATTIATIIDTTRASMSENPSWPCHSDVALVLLRVSFLIRTPPRHSHTPPPREAELDHPSKRTLRFPHPEPDPVTLSPGHRFHLWAR